MNDLKQGKWKNTIDNILIYNLYILIFGAIFLGTSFILSVNGNSTLYNLFPLESGSYYSIKFMNR